MPDIGYLNTRFMPLEDLCVSPEDRGYQFGDGVYELIRVYGGVPFCYQEHLARLEQSAREIRIPFTVEKKEWEGRLLKGIQRSRYDNAKIYIQVTRGIAPREHQFPKLISPTILMTVREMVDLNEDVHSMGVAAITLEDIRWARCDIKSLNLLPNILAKQKAKESGAYEAIFLRDGSVTEGSSSNVMLVKRGQILTPSANSHILSGVTRNVVLKLGKNQGLEVYERDVKAYELEEADELFLVSTTIEVIPVTTLNGKPIKSGLPGPITNLIRSRFTEFVHAKLSLP